MLKCTDFSIAGFVIEQVVAESNNSIVYSARQLADSHYAIGNLEKACDFYRRAEERFVELAKHPNGELLAKMARCKYELHQFDQCEHDLKEAIDQYDRCGATLPSDFFTLNLCHKYLRKAHAQKAFPLAEQYEEKCARLSETAKTRIVGK